MKKMIYMGALVLVATSGIFWSCQKDEGLLNPGDELMLKVANVKPTPTLTISYDPAPGMVGEDVTISAIVSYEDLPLNCGQVQLFRALDASGNPCPVAQVATWDNVWGQPKDAPGGTYLTTYSAAGFYGWKAQYESSGRGCEYENLTGNDAVTFDISIVDGCTNPLTITPFLVSGSGLGNLYTFTTQWKVKACEDFKDLKTQGGLTAGSTVISTSPVASNIKNNKQNVIINWVRPTFAAGEEIYTVVFTRNLKNTCTTYDITGAWSAKAWPVIPVLDELGNPIQTVAGYENKLYFTTPCP